MLLRRTFLAGSSAIVVAAPARAIERRGDPAPLPPGYIAMGQRHGVPPLLLYGVALQESKDLFGEQSLPHPWTLCVRGKPLRFSTQAVAVHHLQHCVAAGVTNVDCGLMQVNWRYHQRRLQSFARALDPYSNIAVGAGILREHFDATGDWFEAVGRYHHPSNTSRANAYARSVFARLPRIPRGRTHA
ncbi:MAG TPA: lytic transglycosylase domain-containing protein [Burkholderiaceae bacterium]|nr:lytic transglycosylase domain-containing protein [Burkholderiaceae bacterium]